MAELERASELNYFPQKTDRLREAVETLLGERTPGGGISGISFQHASKTQPNQPNDAVLRGKPPEV
jgi:hypothetical protein